MKEKRGVSPLIATVLLVAIVIVVAFLIFWWYGELIDRELDKSEATAEQACIQKVSFSMSDPKCTDGPETNEKIISFSVENTGQIRLSSFRIIAEGEDSFSQEIAQGVEQGIETKLSFLANTDDYGFEYEVEVIPMINAGQTTKYCSEKTGSFVVSCS